MYPPRKQSESVEEESNRVQGAWIFAIVFICLGVVSILCFHDFLWGSSQVLLGVVLATDEVLVKKSSPQEVAAPVQDFNNDHLPGSRCAFVFPKVAVPEHLFHRGRPSPTLLRVVQQPSVSTRLAFQIGRRKRRT